MTQARRATDAGEPTNAQLRAELMDFRASFEIWMRDHAKQHIEEQREFTRHLQEATRRDLEIDSLETVVPDVKAAHDLIVQVGVIKGIVFRMQWGVLVAVVTAVAALIIEAFFPHAAPIVR